MYESIKAINEPMISRAIGAELDNLAVALGMNPRTLDDWIPDESYRARMREWIARQRRVSATEMQFRDSAG